MSQNQINYDNYDPTTWVPKAESHGTKSLWKTFAILSVITFLDIILYFTIDPGMPRNITFIILGIVKAAYIVYVFMHMVYERVGLKYSIILPMIFVIYLILLLLIEADFWNYINHLVS